MRLAHAFGVAGLHLEYLLFGVVIAGLGIWMIRTGADVRGGWVLLVIGVVLVGASAIVN